MKKFKVALAAGHGGHGVTPGKRTPDGEYEWNFNNKVISSAIEFLEQYDDVIDVLRIDDPSGRTDVPLSLRSYKANAWNADILVADHHNANTGRWGNWTGTETYTYIGDWEDAERLAGIIHNNVLGAYGLRDRGLKKADFHMLRETQMPAILIEGGYMDSVIDIEKLRDDDVLRNAGIAIGKGVLEYAGIKERKTSIQEVDMLDKAIVIFDFPDMAFAEILAARLQAPVYTRAALPNRKVAKELYVVGGTKEGLEGKADKLIMLTGRDRFDVAREVAEFLK